MKDVDAVREVLADVSMSTLAEAIGAGQLIALVRELNIEKARKVYDALEVVDMSEVASMIGVNYHRVKMLRRGEDGSAPSPDRLPPTIGVAGSSPIYLRREVMLWAQQTGRVNAAGQPIRLRPVGRTPRARRQRDESGRFAAVA